MTSPDDNSSETEPSAASLPEGYLWRFCVFIVFMLGGVVCLWFFNAIIGVLISLAGLAFAKRSGLDEIVASSAKDAER
uniref:hypothetical protein n=1 Tax=Castellaniella defragrans TaxID=75697 RepID=UPI00334274FE